MGAYLSKPITDKSSEDEEDDKIKTGASSMQGWRETQEDAHNCLLRFDKNTYFFAVYDGHGGREVALYCAQKLPNYIMETEAYKNEDLAKALIDGFLGFDATLTNEDVVGELRRLVDEAKDESDVSDEENVNRLYEEASMPLDEVIEKYKHINSKVPLVEDLADRPPVSPYLRACKSKKGSEGSSKEKENTDSTVLVNSSSSLEQGDSLATPSSSNNVTHIEEEKLPVVKENENKLDQINSSSVSTENISEKKLENEKEEISISDKEDPVDSKPQENGKISRKGKGKVSAKTKGITVPEKKSRPKRTAKQMYLELLASESQSESEDDEDQTFEEPNDDSSDDEVNTAIPVDDSDESSDANNAEDEEEEVDQLEEEEEEEEDDDDQSFNFASDVPGISSGCTAVVALMRGTQIHVANAGDSRCIVCRNGKAIDMSIDHKPEDDLEFQRITKAGGRVNFDGRVNGGLNLSRAIGDHSYKLNKEIPDREQMITALPDIQTHNVSPGDEFMVLACDGIWNFMSSQEVADFVKCRLEKQPEKVSQICEELFENCLASNTLGDGTGCDNMTAIIIVFKSGLFKRSAPTDAEQSDNTKRAKTDDAETFVQQETAV